MKMIRLGRGYVLVFGILATQLSIGCNYHKDRSAPTPVSQLDRHRVAPEGVTWRHDEESRSSPPMIEPTRVDLRDLDTLFDPLPEPICPGDRKDKTRYRRPDASQDKAGLGFCPANGKLVFDNNLCDFFSFTAEGDSPVLEGSFNPPGLNSAASPACEPPDTSVAVGEDHVVVAVNSLLHVYDHEVRASMPGPIQLTEVFQNVSGCDGILFDPVVLYDEQRERFFLGADNDGEFYCFAYSDVNDPFNWCTYPLPVAGAGQFFDFPRAGVGHIFIFMSANIFNTQSGTVQARIWSLPKDLMADCMPMPIPTNRTLSSGASPQPMNAHGYSEGTWPTDGEHFFLTNYPDLDSTGLALWSWNGVQASVSGPQLLDLDNVLQVTVGNPEDTPQPQGLDLQPIDQRPLANQYRNGHLWTAQSVSCRSDNGNPVNAIRWAKIDVQPMLPQIVNAGISWVPSSNLMAPSLAVNDCDEVILGYTRSDGSRPLSAHFVLGEDGFNGTFVNSDTCCKAGEGTYAGTPPVPPEPPASYYRWGDYTGATSSPGDGRLWHFGQFSRNTSFVPNHGFSICKIHDDCLPRHVIFPDGFESGDTSAWSSSAP